MKQKKILSNVAVYLILVTLLIFNVHAAQSAVNLGTAGDFVILSKSGISTTGTTSIIGNIGVSPIDSTGITGFGLIMDPSNKLSSSFLVTGKIYASDYASPTPVIMTTAIHDMETAYVNAAGRTETNIVTELGAGDISGLTLAPGLYKWGTDVVINNGVTLSGSSNDIWIFQIAQDLTVGNGAVVTLSGGAQAKNVFWQVAGQATLGTTSDVKGIILSQTAIVMNTGATLKGRALAQTAVTLNANVVTAPSGVVVPSSVPEEEPSPAQNNSDDDSDDNRDNDDDNDLNDDRNDDNDDEHDDDTDRNDDRNDDNDDGRNDDRNSDRNGITTVASLKKIKVLASTKTDADVDAKVYAKRAKAESKEDIIARINLKTGLNISLSENVSQGAILRVFLSNGKYADIKILPADASARAQVVMKTKCDERNCTIELKENRVNGTTKAVYEVTTKKKAKMFRFINTRMKIRVIVDAETGEIITVKRPLWSFLAKEEVVLEK